MELYRRVIELIDANLIYCLIPIILTLILTERFFKNRFETKKTLNLVSWTIIIYTTITWAFYLFGMFINPNDHAFINRATGPYAFAYWVMFLLALILPFTLFIKKLATKFWYVILVAFAMKIGVYFERYVIIVTSFHRDYLPRNNSSKLENRTIELIDVFTFGIGITFLQGVLITILTLGILEVIKNNKPS